MKKALLIVISIVMIMSMAACNKDGIKITDRPKAPASATKVPATTAPAGDNVYSKNGIKMDLPAGWTEVTEDGETTIIPDDYLTSLNSISVTVEEKMDIASMEQKDLETMLGEEVEGVFTFKDFEKFQIDGRNALKIACEMDIEIIKATIYYYYLDATESTVVVAFAQMGTTDIKPVIDSCMGSLKFT